jgi:imidazolonepropionase-like amidohydrolase
MLTRCLLLLPVALLSAFVPIRAQAPLLAIVGATVIDGNGGAPLPHAVIIIEGDRIANVGAAVPVPAGAQIVDATGKWIVPGMVDTNVHLSLYGGMNERYESLVR